jgi:uncharacterized protein YbbC (DUF1343 family)
MHNAFVFPFAMLMALSSGLCQVMPGDTHMEAYLPMLEGKRVGVVCNHTAVVHNAAGTPVHLIDTLIARGIEVRAAFGPEHGFRGDLPDGEKAQSGTDTRSGIAVRSLYGTHKKPSAAQLEDIEIMVFDIQDVGVRCYTFLSTLFLVMEACAEQEIPLVILDRPNPNGHLTAGPMLDTSLVRSFVGFLPIPLAHGMTLGELADMGNQEGWLGGGYSHTPTPALRCDLHVIPVTGWTRQQKWSPQLAPSPNLPSAEAIQLYPHLVLLEATLASVGRGTSAPFTMVGFPGMLRAAHRFTPTPNAASKYPKHAGKECQGFSMIRRLGAWNAQQGNGRLHLDVLLELQEGWMSTPAGDQSPFIDRPEFFDQLAGGPSLRLALEKGTSLQTLAAQWTKARSGFMESRSRYLRYPDGH